MTVNNPTTSNTDHIVLPTADLGFSMPKDVDAAAVAATFVEQLGAALSSADGQALADMLLPIGWWRDVLAFTRDLRCFSQAAVAAVFGDIVPEQQVRNVRVSDRPPPEAHNTYPDLAWVQVHFTFDAAVGRCGGGARLVHQGGAWRVWTLFTTVDELAGHVQRAGFHRPYGEHNPAEPHAEKRAREREFADGDPDVLIVGAGHNGLALATQLRAYGVRALVVDRQARLGDNWRRRYASLSLHDIVHANHLPFMPFPATWPLFIPAGKIANWMEAYADAMDLDVWLESTVDASRSRFDDETQTWSMTVLRTVDGKVTERTISVSHVALATGLVGGKAYMPPAVPGQAEWAGSITHTSQHAGGKGADGQRVLVVGASTSAHDVSADFVKHGAQVTMLQRSPTFVMTFNSALPMLCE